VRRHHRFAQMTILVLSLSVALSTACAREPEAAPGGKALVVVQPVAAKPLQNSIGMTLMPIPAGEFLMGSPEPQPEKLILFGPKSGKWWKLIEGPQHKVTLTKPFYIGATEVTLGQWKAVMGSNPNPDQSDDNVPVVLLSWDDCQSFLKRLSEKEGRTYRLPTEAEWEYACRAGSTTKFSFGDDEAKLDEYAWHAKDNPKEFKVRPVGQKKPNAWGLYDVHGNAWEWCQDRYSRRYEAKEQVDPTGPAKDWGDRVIRGGARFGKPTTCSSTCRNAYEGDYRLKDTGLRVVLASAEVVPVVKPTDEKPPLSFEQRISSPKEKARLEKLGAVRNSVGMLLMPISSGEFMMGYAESKYEQPVHKVKITKSFHMGATEVTQAQWQAVMGNNPSFIIGADRPVENISWGECQEFVKKLSEKEGKTYCLPTEAEWEYACRAGSTTKFYFGDDVAPLGDYAWHGANSNVQTHPVGQKKANAWGLYDMYGNVWEWCQDRIARYEEGEQIDPTGGTKGSQRVFRGGAWYNGTHRCRSASRKSRHPTASFSRNYFGLRVVLRPEK
jgi:formylglycine-generating enzyme required for sulfatase activity